jgi:hypothetical protein
MPRRSTASLIIAAPIKAPAPRLPVPATLTDAERSVWQETVAALPASWFGAEQGALLERYCRHVVRARCLEALLRDVDPAGDLDRYARLARLAGEESGRILALARSLRLTLLARTHAVTAANAAANRPAPGIRALFEGSGDA